MAKTPEVGPNKAGFVFGETADTGPNKVLGVAPVEAYLVQYTDGASKRCVRMVFKVLGSKSAFLLQEKIHGSFVATEGTAWFNEAFFEKLVAMGLEPKPESKAGEKKDGVESV